jgi:hypothetical protein
VIEPDAGFLNKNRNIHHQQPPHALHGGKSARTRKVREHVWGDAWKHADSDEKHLLRLQTAGLWWCFLSQREKRADAATQRRDSQPNLTNKHGDTSVSVIGGHSTHNIALTCSDNAFVTSGSSVPVKAPDGSRVAGAIAMNIPYNLRSSMWYNNSGVPCPIIFTASSCSSDAAMTPVRLMRSILRWEHQNRKPGRSQNSRALASAGVDGTAGGSNSDAKHDSKNADVHSTCWHAKRVRIKGAKECFILWVETVVSQGWFVNHPLWLINAKHTPVTHEQTLHARVKTAKSTFAGDDVGRNDRFVGTIQHSEH